MIHRPPFGAGFFSEHKMIIGLTGRKRSGKSTIAQALVHKGFTEFSFAEPIRTFTKILLGLDHAGLEEAKEKEIEWLDSIVTPRYAPIEKYTPIQAESSIRCAIMAGASTAGKARPSAIKVC